MHIVKHFHVHVHFIKLHDNEAHLVEHKPK